MQPARLRHLSRQAVRRSRRSSFISFGVPPGGSECRRCSSFSSRLRFSADGTHSIHHPPRKECGAGWHVTWRHGGCDVDISIAVVMARIIFSRFVRSLRPILSVGRAIDLSIDMARYTPTMQSYRGMISPQPRRLRRLSNADAGHLQRLDRVSRHLASWHLGILASWHLWLALLTLQAFTSTYQYGVLVHALTWYFVLAVLRTPYSVLFSMCMYRTVRSTNIRLHTSVAFSQVLDKPSVLRKHCTVQDLPRCH